MLFLEDSWIAIFQIGAIVCPIMSILPQIRKAYITKSLEDLSWGMLLLMSTGIICWIGYGLHISDPVILTADSILIVLLMILSALKIKYKHK